MRTIIPLLRRTISFTKRQWAHLSERANSLETSVSDIVRRLIDEDIERKK